MPLSVTALPGAGTAKPETISTSGQTPKGAAAATEDAEECFKKPWCDDFSRWWYNHDKEAKEDTETDAAVSEPLVIEDPLLRTIPKPGTQENYKVYVERLEDLELAPAPQVLPDYATDPARGPEVVVQVNPAPKTQVEPGTTVKVRYNAPNAPEATGDTVP